MHACKVIHTFIWTCIYIIIHIYVHISSHLFYFRNYSRFNPALKHIHINIYMYIYIFLHVYTYIHIYSHIYIYVYIVKNIHLSICRSFVLLQKLLPPQYSLKANLKFGSIVKIHSDGSHSDGSTVTAMVSSAGKYVYTYLLCICLYIAS
jgi:hypothetical protein